MRILLPSDVFPPGSVGGAAWSAHALAYALITRGHNVTAIVPREGMRGKRSVYAVGVPAVHWGYRTPRLPFARNYFRHERLWRPLADVIVATASAEDAAPLVIHAQHAQVTPAAVIAGRRLGVPVVATVRDHWPWDYFATGLHADRLPCARATWASLAADLPMRMGALRGTLAFAALPYIIGHVRRRAAFLAQADAIIAVSNYIAQRLARIAPDARIYVIPNMVDLAANADIAAKPPRTDLDGPFMLFVGKLERNKGAGLLTEIFQAAVRAGVDATKLPRLIVAGTGSLKSTIERDLGALGVPTSFLAWADHDEVLRLMARCEVLLFPSAWGEPLSRVLLEAGALGAPILAMPTGGTPDIISDGVNGALAATPEQFARLLASLLADPSARSRIGAAARETARRQFATEIVAPQIERLYMNL